MNNNLTNRELSWLAFNERVLQEAEDPNNPLLERLRFLGIFSNNLDEFFKVRVASLNRLIDITKNSGNKKELTKILKKIRKKTDLLQKRFDHNFDVIALELEKNNIFFTSDKQVNEEQKAYLKEYFYKEVYLDLIPIMIGPTQEFPRLVDHSAYLAITLFNKENDQSEYALIEIPSHLDRFILLPKNKDKTELILLDDLIRLNLELVFHSFNYDNIEAYSIKVTRDAELDFDNDVAEGILEKLNKSLRKRKRGLPVRLVYDKSIQDNLLSFLLKQLKIKTTESVTPGGRFHNFKDFIGFPSLDLAGSEFKPMPPLFHPDIQPPINIMNTLQKKDILIHHPYQDYKHIIQFIREAAIDPKVKTIKILIYRLSNNSKIVNALINAAKNGKKVLAVIELKARFDEESNIKWSNVLQAEGVKVLHGFEDMKIHAKLCTITRLEGGILRNYACVSTGNFNESSARIYTDLSLLTAHKSVTKELQDIFQIIEGKFAPIYHRHIVLSPKHLRNKLVRLINIEIKNAQLGKKAHIRIKINNLVDDQMVEKLYQASQAGVKIDMVVRGICRLNPGVPGLSENIRVISILDRFLEHGRFMIFHNDGEPKYYISSADWMMRNLERRIELTCPIYDKNIQQELEHIFSIQFGDNVKSRIVDQKQTNKYSKNENNDTKNRAQYQLYQYYKEKLEHYE